MEKTIKVDDKEVKFKATAGTPRRYLATFHRDLIKDIQKLSDNNNKEYSPELLEVFLNASYIMAKQADDTIPDNVDDWLDEFEIFSIYQVLPEILSLWGEQVETSVESKKKLIKKQQER